MPTPAAVATPVASSRRASPWIAAACLLALGSRRRWQAPVKFFLRAVGQPRLTNAWLGRLIQPDVAPLWMAHPRIATKLQRPYVSCAWSTLERLGALMGHYDVLPRFFSPAAREAIYGHGLTLLRLVFGASGRWVDARLSYQDQFEKEGELTLELRDAATGLTLAGLTFCIAYNAGRRLIVIGGLQASPDPRMRGLIHDLAKECHGLRPKALALWCLQELAACWQVTQIQAVGDDQHIYRHRQKRREFAACYDEFWTESDGRRLAGGGWELPLKLRPRSRDELKPNRRKAHERRYAMLDALRPNLRASTESLFPGAAAEWFASSTPAEAILVSREAISETSANVVLRTPADLAVAQDSQ